MSDEDQYTDDIILLPENGDPIPLKGIIDGNSFRTNSLNLDFNPGQIIASAPRGENKVIVATVCNSFAHPNPQTNVTETQVNLHAENITINNFQGDNNTVNLSGATSPSLISKLSNAAYTRII